MNAIIILDFACQFKNDSYFVGGGKKWVSDEKAGVTLYDCCRLCKEHTLCTHFPIFYPSFWLYFFVRISQFSEQSLYTLISLCEE